MARKYTIVVLSLFLYTCSMRPEIAETIDDKEFLHEQESSGDTMQQDEFAIDFDAIDRELDSLPIIEVRSENSWWITKQIKHFGTRIMIKALLGYIATQELCAIHWNALSRKIQSLIAVYPSAAKRQMHEQQER